MNEDARLTPRERLERMRKLSAERAASRKARMERLMERARARRARRAAAANVGGAEKSAEEAKDIVGSNEVAGNVDAPESPS